MYLQKPKLMGERSPLLRPEPTFPSLRRGSFRISDTAGYDAIVSEPLTGSAVFESSEDETSASDSSSAHSQEKEPPTWYRQTLDLLFSEKMKYVYKCSLAYLLTSMVVYSPLRHMYGKSENKHMAPTVAVYFHPARTMGSMGESIVFVFASLFYSSFMASTSMLVSNWFMSRDMKTIGYSVDLIVFCAFGLGSIAFMKQRVNKPTFDTACNVAAIFLITTLVKEGNVQTGTISFSRILSVFSIVSAGIFMSAFVCFVLWPERAVSKVRKAINKSMQINSELLVLLTDNFIDCENLHGTRYIKLKEEFNACFKQLHQHLSDAKYELYFLGKERELEILKNLANSSYKMSLHLNGLGSSAFTQWSIIEDEAKSSKKNHINHDAAHAALKKHVSIASLPSLASISTREALHRFGSSTSIHGSVQNTQASTALFQGFISSLGPPMKHYIHTIKTILDIIPVEKEYGTDKPRYLNETIKATDAYSAAREKALAKLYRQNNFQKERDFQSAASEEGAAACCGNFSYLLEQFGDELILFQQILAAYDKISRCSPRSFRWLRFWEKQSPLNHPQTESLAKLLDTSRRNTWKSYQKLTWLQKLWQSLYFLRRPDVQFGYKVGIGAMVFAMPAFSERFRPVFTRWRGEWGIIIYTIIMNKSVGGTTEFVNIRILGTFLGAVVAYLTWLVFPENPYVQPVCAWLVSMPCFWIILHWKGQNMFGRYILLTFNISLLYTYSVWVMYKSHGDEGNEEPIAFDIAYHRFVSVCAGVIWALVITLFVLPNSARSRLKRGLSLLWLQMGLVWKGDLLAKAENERRVAGVQGENLMQLAMIELNALLVHAPSEMRLRGPFPTKEYTALLKSTQNILDAFQDISVLVAKDPKASSQVQSIMEYTSGERGELCSRIFLYFYLLSSSTRLRFPLPEKMPSTDHAIERMLAKLNEYRLSKLAESGAEDENEDYGYEEDFVLFYSYILVTINITEELATMALHIQGLFGVIEDDMLIV